MSDSLFFETTEQCNTAQLSFRLRNAAELAQVARRRKVLVLGKPESLGAKGDAVFQVLERSAGTVIQTRVSCTDSTLPKLAKILTAQDLAGKHGNPGLIFLAEPDYGPAFERLCGILDFGVPVLFPSGYLLPGFKGACVDYSLPECAAIKDLRASLAALAGKKVMIWNCGVFFRDLLLPVLKAYGPQIEICGLTDLDKNTWGGELAGYTVYQPADLARLDYDLLVFSTEMPAAFYPAMHFYAKDFTPLLAMHPYCGAGGRVSSAGLAHSLLAARSGRDLGAILSAKQPAWP